MPGKGEDADNRPKGCVSMRRREFLGSVGGAGAVAALGLPGRVGAQVAAPLFAPPPPIVPIRATPDRIFRTTVCLRPFRAAGPRFDVEQVGRKHVIRHYGHGGSGWSLSWGSADIAVAKAMALGAKEIAVIGAGAIGLTTAITAQRAGAKVTIYAKERFPDVRSARATGTWSPDSRIALASAVAPDFPALWEQMTRASYARHMAFLGTPGDPVEWTERYTLADRLPDPATNRAASPAGAPDFAEYGDRVRDLTPRGQMLPPGSHPFATPFARRNSSIAFNIADLARQLEMDFLIAGGRFVPMEFNETGDFAKLKEKVVIACTGYGSRALFRDESILPVRGQIAWLIPQEGAHYGIYYNRVSVLARRDGIVVQDVGSDETFGYNDPNETIDRVAAEASVAVVAAMFAQPAATIPAVVPG